MATQKDAKDPTLNSMTVRFDAETIARLDRQVALEQARAKPGTKVVRADVIRYFVIDGLDREEKKRGAK